jgi:hypothetical protein
MKLKEAIGIFDNIFTPSECKNIISKLEKAITSGEAYSGQSGDGGNTHVKKTTDYNILSHTKHKFTSQLIMEKFNDTLSNKYLENFPNIREYSHHRIVNQKTFYPLLQIQKYDKNSGHYNAWHVEAEDKNTSDRAFVFILYLNDVEKGGETGFLIKEKGDFLKIQPKVGRLVIHPAAWPFIHKGYMPKSSDKYILTTWLCWKDQN